MRLRVLVIVAAVLLLVPGAGRAQDSDGDGIEDSVETSLIAEYAPRLYFHPGERYLPTSIQFALDHSTLERYNTSGPPELVLGWDRTPLFLSAYNALPTSPDEQYYLNNSEGTVRDDSAILAAYQAGSYPPTAYAHVFTEGPYTVVQFWFYYAFNPGTWNSHEGDWEMVQVLVQDAAPVQASYSQHHRGETVSWGQVTKQGNHPNVYVALGSHANFVAPYEGQIGIEGDRVSDAGTSWGPTDYTAVNVGEPSSPSPGNEWIGFAGRWGEFSLDGEARGEAGPEGPAFRENQVMFGSPVDWANGIDARDSTWFLLNWLIANLLLLFVILFAAFAAFRAVRLWRLHRKTGAGVKMWPWAHLRPFDRKSAAMVVGLVGLIVGLVGFLLPWYVVTANVDAPGFLVTGGDAEFLRMDGISGMTVNPFRPGGGLIGVSVLPLPIGTMLLVTTAYFLFRVGGTKTSRRLGGKFIGKGIVAILPFVLVLLIVAMLLPTLPPDDPGVVGPDDFLGPIGASPLGGSTSVTVDGGSATLRWGLGIGAWLLIVSAVLMFVAGGLALSQRYSFLPQWYVDGHERPEDAAAAPAAAPAEPPAPEEPIPEASDMEPPEPPAAEPPDFEPPEQL